MRSQRECYDHDRSVRGKPELPGNERGIGWMVEEPSKQCAALAPGQVVRGPSPQDVETSQAGRLGQGSLRPAPR